MQWYYLDDAQQQVPVDESQLPVFVQQGVIRADTLIWAEGLPEWVAAQQAKPELFQQQQAVAQPVVATPAAATPQLATARPAQRKAPIKRAGATRKSAARTAGATAGAAQAVAATGGDCDVRSMGALLAQASGWMKFVGVLNFLSFSAIVPIFLGIRCFKIADASAAAAQSGDPARLAEALESVRSYFKIQGIFILVMIAIYIVMVILLVVGGGLAALSVQ